jgi:hypothetical protein
MYVLNFGFSKPNSKQTNKFLELVPVLRQLTSATREWRGN